MESMKAKPAGFTSKNYSGNYLKNTTSKSKRKKLLLKPNERKVIEDLEGLYLNTLKLTAEKDKIVLKLRHDYEAKYQKIFEERFQILQEFRKQFQDELKSGKENKIYNFWMNVLKNSALGLVTNRDDQILMHLIDIRSSMAYDPELKFVLEFHFEPNQYFDNEILTKSFFIDCDLDKENPLNYDGPSIVRCEGCDIKWKDQNHISSEFDFISIFSPPELSEDCGMNQFIETIAILENDFNIGLFIKENIIPKAVLLLLDEDPNQSEDSEDSETSFLQL